SEGVVYINPDEKILSRLKMRQQIELKREELIKGFKNMDTFTADGRRIKLYANINSASDAKLATDSGAEGIGLMRSEFLYMNRTDYPDEETQFAAYKSVLESMPDKRVIIRTLDIGADKKADYFGLEKEENPALGYRAIRICLDRKDMFKSQLRALYRASAYGRLAIMFPMIISVEEVRAAKACAKEVMEELKKENIPYDENAEIGIMIETPAAAIISDMLANVADFFSIGTNDLTQYTLAVDRQNSVLEGHYDPYHPALKRMIKTVIDNAHSAGIWVGVCGELGGDTNMTEWFIRSGIDELSAAPSLIPELRKRISEINLKI
ncbi:MAG: phosphoenolpyruvate--protein phosphotransferase, partial [Oscillospiraceae bacterium]|nr:phosphoenolpyruvate--protein phosphotransferase [Oscillospiraceae bacterium]